MSRNKSKKDPHAAREAEKYENPIASREFIMQQLSEAGTPLSMHEISQALRLQPTQLEALKRRLGAMERDGQLVRNRRGSYGLPAKMDLVQGRVIAHRDGFGFLVPDSGEGGDLFLPEPQMRSLLHGDRALVRVVRLDRKGRREGALVEVLERNTREVVGRFFKQRGLAFIEPTSSHIHQNIVVPPEESGEAKNGQMVVVQLLEQPGKHQPAVGRVIEVLGEHMAPGMEVDIAIRDHNLPHQWAEEVLKALVPLKRQKKIPAKQLKGRTDFRDLPLVTIDGEDSRDFDDAVYCEPKGKGWRLLVAIADVSAYVVPGTPLDVAARERGNSVYFPGRVIPMLPEILSNEWCSLNPQVDRLCLVCEMHLNKHGGFKQVQFHEGIMCSAARLTYTQVNAALQGDANAVASPLLPHLRNLHALYKVLKERRDKRGAIDFETTETRIIFSPERKIEGIVPVQRNDAHRLIEEMMLAANVATAEWLEQEQMPLLYRVHNGPTEEKLKQLRGFLAELGLSLNGKDQPHSKHYAKLLAEIQGRPDKRLVQTVLLRSMKMAVYTPDNTGHFGLGYDSYTHFTSPIRRYPDLLVHRAIRHRLQGKTAQNFGYSEAELLALGEHCSMTERRADEAGWDVTGWLKCEYMKDKVGEVYQGLVTAVTSFGLFVELDDIFVEGLVHVTALHNDYYHFDPVGQRLQGERSGTVYRLSDRLKVKLVRVDLEQKKIDFELA